MPRTHWDRGFKYFFGNFFNRLGITPLTEYPVAQEALTVDVVVRLGEGDLEKLCAVTPFDFFCVHNLIEFKSPRDPLNLSEYRLITGRVYVYLSQQKDISRHQISSCVITSTKPVKVLTKLKDEVIFTEIADGHYVSDDKIPMHVLVTTELPLAEKNYPLLLFSTGKKREQFLRKLAEEGRIEYLRFAYELYPQDVRRFLAMSRPFRDFPPLEENIRFFIKDFGAEKILSEMTVEEIKGFGAERILSEITIEELQELEENDRKRLLKMLIEIEAEKSENTPQNTSEGQQEK